MPLIDTAIREELHDYVGGAIRSFGGQALRVGGVDDHLHVLSKVEPTRDVSSFVRGVKANSSRWMHARGRRELAWQVGYGAFPVSQSQVERVRRYVAMQDLHPRSRSFEDEFIAFLTANAVEFGERIVRGEE